MAAAVHSVNGLPRKAPARAPIKRPVPVKKGANGVARASPKAASPVQNKAASVAGDSPASGGGVTSAYAIMANRIANRVAEMAESITFVERHRPQEPAPTTMPAEAEKKKPRKLDIRLNGSTGDSVAFSAPFLDNTLQKMLLLQNRMLKSSADLSKVVGVDDKVLKEHAAQSAELSKIIALICAEKARQGA